MTDANAPADRLDPAVWRIAGVAAIGSFMSQIDATVVTTHARRRGDAALIDLRQPRIKAFSASILTMFLLNGVLFAGQMLVPIHLIRGYGISPSRTVSLCRFSEF